MNKGKKVFVGLSGGVDSAVSAALLKEQGFDVTGVFIKVWQPDFLTCTWREERRDAMRVAAKLDIPFLFFDFETEYKRGVADYMIEEYRRGRTPNPDVMCNREVKFGAFWSKAKEMGADFIATGHYARNEDGRLREGVDTNKDQSYFLYTLTQEDLEHTLFPIGHLKKEEVRRLAKKFGLANADKADSQGICFLGDVDLETFLSNFIETKQGDVLLVSGEVIGKHRGALYYTLGERHGFEVLKKDTSSKPFYVVSKDMKANTITVSNKELEIEDHKKKEIFVENINWINKSNAKELDARVRYRQEKIKITMSKEKVIFKEAQTVASGQAIVFYDGNECLGGGIIGE
jgi:tRNA (5-methylaminomethyl-2-thiouridylate)-methyltransferase